MLRRLTRGSDNLDTPEAALIPLLPYLSHKWIIWECAPGNFKLVDSLEKYDYSVASSKNIDFLSNKGVGEAYDAIVTNPPFSKKAQFIARCMEIGKPWALLLPVTTLGSRKCQVNLHNAEVIFLPKRIDFTGKKAPWFAVAWFTWGLDIGKQMTFLEG